MLNKVTNNLRIKGNRINLQFKVIALFSLIALGFVSLGGTAFADDVTVNPGDDIEWTFDQHALTVKLRYWAKTTDASAVAGTDYKKINGYVEVGAGKTEIKVKTETYENSNATDTLAFVVELVNPQYYDGSNWVDVPMSASTITRAYNAGGEIYYANPDAGGPSGSGGNDENY